MDILSAAVLADIQRAIVQLSPWTNHKLTCARVTRNDACDCGLSAAMLPYFLR